MSIVKIFLDFTEKKYYFVFVPVILSVRRCMLLCIMCFTNRNTNKKTY